MRTKFARAPRETVNPTEKVFLVSCWTAEFTSTTGAGQRAGDDKLMTKATSKARKENKIQKLTQSVEAAPKGMLNMATELRELRGLPEAIQKQFDEDRMNSRIRRKP